MIKTISIENAKRLTELGVKRNAYFLRRAKTGEIFTCSNMTGLEDAEEGVFLPSYTACELGEMLPREFGGGEITLTRDSKGSVWFCSYFEVLDYEPPCRKAEEYAPSIADAMALMLIWLLENGRVTVEEVNR